MKQKRRVNPWIGLVAGLLLITAAIPAGTVFTDQPRIALFIIVAGVALIVTSMTGIYLRSRKEDAEDPDERDRKIQRATFSDSWIITFWLALILLCIDFTGIIELQATAVLVAILYTMGISATFFRWKHSEKGDVE
ncbi:hypothetical protein E2N92_07095 [Methanofollis formosanus]|uniref:DUF2178 domain-containing protein n=1 Tax=Methanofollis formosanus TaxID=299308 RepID=A0A8G1EGR9_9EURY|nr:hypothetical protein [Methanofollis formosanus]QYZ79217.1 hypothetical protein E2N92_07095 [Methanofollis formosanus]